VIVGLCVLCGWTGYNLLLNHEDLTVGCQWLPSIHA